MQTDQAKPAAPNKPAAPIKKVRTLGRRINALARTRWGLFWLGLISFLESTIIPMATEPLVAPIMATSRRPYTIATTILVGCILGALAGYGLGWVLSEPVIAPLVERFGWTADYQYIIGQLKNEKLWIGFWAVFLVGLTPFPFQIGTVGAGVAGFSLPLFVLAVAISRFIRYFGVALLADILGRKAGKWLERHMALILFGGTGGLMVIFLIVGLLT